MILYLAIGLFIVVCLARVGIEHWHRSKWYSARQSELELSAKRRLEEIDAAPLPSRDPHAIVGSLNHSHR